MKDLAILPLVAVALTGCERKPMPLRLDKFCVTESGMSNYWLSTSAEQDGSRPDAQRGWLRYQFMGQDIRYSLKGAERQGKKIIFHANFDGSLTGETSGQPFIISYDVDANTLRAGSDLANCQNIQGAGAPVERIDHLPDATGFEQALATSNRE